MNGGCHALPHASVKWTCMLKLQWAIFYILFLIFYFQHEKGHGQMFKTWMFLTSKMAGDNSKIICSKDNVVEIICNKIIFKVATLKVHVMWETPVWNH